MIPILIILALLVILLISINIKILGVIQALLDRVQLTSDQVCPRLENIEREIHSIFLDIMEVLEKLEDLKFK